MHTTVNRDMNECIISRWWNLNFSSDVFTHVILTLVGLRWVWRQQSPVCVPAAGVWGGRLFASEGWTRNRTGRAAARSCCSAGWERWSRQLVAQENTAAPVYCPYLLKEAKPLYFPHVWIRTIEKNFAKLRHRYSSIKNSPFIEL